jgi:hypothetical protein
MIYHKLRAWAGVDVIVDLDSIVEIDGSEAVRRRLTPSSTSTHVAALTRARSAELVHVQRRRWTQRRTSPSRSTPGVNDQVDVDDHDGEDRSASTRTCDE